MLTDYKFSYIIRDDSGFITEAGIRVYEGEYRDKQVLDLETMQPITKNQYVRTKRLTQIELPHLDSTFIKEIDGSDVCVFTIAQFGQIKTDAELLQFINTKTDKDPNRTIVSEQSSKI